MQSGQISSKKKEIEQILKNGVKNVAPLWSLENFVAVNPYLGMTGMDFSDAMGFLHVSSNVHGTLPIAFYLEALSKGKMTKEDLSRVLMDNRFGITSDVDEFLVNCIDQQKIIPDYGFKNMTDVASEVNGKRWGRFMIDRISFWAAAYFDTTQASWRSAVQSESIFKAWKKEAEIDRSPALMGLKGFRKFIKKLPENYVDAAALALGTLDIPEPTLDHYILCLLMKMNGWVGIAARIDWDARLVARDSHCAEELLTILLVWEMALKELLPYPDLNQAWNEARKNNISLVAQNKIPARLANLLILQEASDAANQRRIVQKINTQVPAKLEKGKARAQAIFCIDVRSEVFRRNLEATDHSIETLGFAGFFAFPINYVPLGHEEGTNQCPVLLTTSHTVKEGFGDPAKNLKAKEKRIRIEQVFKSWKTFKKGAVSCFGFVSPLGLFFLPKLLSDAFGLTRPQPQPNKVGVSESDLAKRGVQLDQDDASATVAGIPLQDRIRMASSALKAMSLTEGFARTVLIVGHGASTVNNPHGTGLDCGACGGHSGEANAKVAAAVLNDPEVRKALKAAEIHIPEGTLFIAALHDTTTDEVTLFSMYQLPDSHKSEVDDLMYSFKLAGEASRKERAKRMMVDAKEVNKQIVARSKDWSQVRPEWGLAGCSSFIVAPRERTERLNLDGKAFMHSYVWKKDKDFTVLELIMTAPMVVTSWINLQYYASTVDNKKLGAGNKTLHNVVGGLGVLEGFGGDLRVGLPMQSVHDGEKYQHEPYRLNVIIEAPVDQMSKILEKHESIRQLCDNHWIYLFAMNDEGKVAYKYVGDLQWEVI